MFKAPAPHIADATRAVVVENRGEVGVVGEMEKGASWGAKERREVNVVDVNLQKELQEQEQEQEQEASQPSSPPAVRQDG